MSPTIFYGAVINPISLTTYSAFTHCLLAVDASGNVEWIVDNVEAHELQETLAAKGYIDAEVVALKDGEFIMPGFIDTHTHAPQVPNMGTGGQYQLLDWLTHVTFPMEGRFSDVDFARRTYQSVVRRVIDAGTTTCCYYGTIHLEATKVLAEIVHAFGQRAFVGKCNMNHDSPSYYIEPSADASIQATREFITYIRALSKPSTSSSQEPLVQPILTPRFAISCTHELLSSLGTLAASDPSLRIQTHIAENPSEVEYTNLLFPTHDHYAAVYDKCGLLRSNTILAHAVHLTDDEVDLIKARDAGISHCPTSNFNLNSGVAPVGAYLDKGIKVGLGTDVSGGFNISILSAIQHASIASKVCSFQARATEPLMPPTASTFTNRPLPIPTLLYLATAGGAAVCGLEDQVGSFAAGKSFDALLVSVREEAGNLGVWGLADSVGGSEEEKTILLERRLEQFLFCGDDRNIERVYVQGRFVGGRTFCP
ncbi:hypothetical protein BDZ97DRAFT_1902411 [Flammula alnicola]|nr:hypothetical protein BDZ97DRAFT_1902411 [Flammula alnicola]